MSKKDFGLGKHRVTLPENEGNYDDDDIEAAVELLDNELKPPEVKKTTSPSIMSKVSRGVKSLFANRPKLGAQGSPSLTRTQDKPSQEPADLINFEDDGGGGGKPSPVLHSRIVTKDLFASDGFKGSLDSLIDEYGLKNEDDNLFVEESGNQVLRLVLKSDGREKQIALQRNPEGLGVRLSTGKAPVFVTLVEPDSEAMLAGIKVSDVILEIDGKDCRAFESSEVAQLLQLKSLIKNSPNLNSRKEMKGSLTITSIDSDTEDDSDYDDAGLSFSQDKVSVDEELFEYEDKKDKFVPMPQVIENDEDLITSTPKPSTSLFKDDLFKSSTNTVNKVANTKTGQSLLDMPNVVVTEADQQLQKPQGKDTPKKDSTLDLGSVPATERLGVNVGRYKRDIGNARKKRPTRLSHRHSTSSLAGSLTNEPIATSESTSKENDQKKPRRTSIDSLRGDKPVPKQKPPVAMRRKSNTLESSSKNDEDDTTKRRYTVGGGMNRQNSSQQLLAQAAVTARSQLRSSFKERKMEEGSSAKETKEKINTNSLVNQPGLDPNEDKPSSATNASTSTKSPAPPKPPRQRDRQQSKIKNDQSDSSTKCGIVQENGSGKKIVEEVEESKEEGKKLTIPETKSSDSEKNNNMPDKAENELSIKKKVVDQNLESKPATIVNDRPLPKPRLRKTNISDTKVLSKNNDVKLEAKEDNQVSSIQKSTQNKGIKPMPIKEKPKPSDMIITVTEHKPQSVEESKKEIPSTNKGHSYGSGNVKSKLAIFEQR